MSFAAIAIATTAVALVGTGVAVYGQVQAANAAEDAAEYNAEIKRNQARQESLAAEENARRKARENARFIAGQRAAIAKNGLSLEGTPLAVLGESAMMLERDIMDLSWDASNRSQALLHGAGMELWEGDSAAASLRTRAVASGLSGVSSAMTGGASSAGYLS